MLKKFILSAAALLCCSATLFADEPQTNTISQTEYVVTVTGTRQSTFDTSQPVNRIDSSELDEKVTTSMATVFEAEPGVDVVKTGTGSIHPMIRGLYGERVLTLVNGVRLSEQRPGGNHVLSLDPAQIERIEVVRGPASVLYGSDAIGGVINFITKDAGNEIGDELRFSGDVSAQTESATDGLKETAHIQFGQGRFNGYIGGTHMNTDNLETPDGDLPNSFYDGFTLWGGGTYTGDGWNAYGDYSFMEADIGIPGSTDFVEDYFKGEQHQKLTFGIEANDFDGSIEKLGVDFGWQRHNRHRYRRKTDNIPPPIVASGGDLAVNIWLDIDTYTMKPQIVLVPNDTHRITMGLDTFYERASSDRTLRDTASAWAHPVFDKLAVIPDSTRLGAGAFVQDEITLGDRWIITPGLRADWIRAEADGTAGHIISSDESSTSRAVSGNLGVLYKATEDVNLYANVGRAFRAPTLLELYFYGPHDVGNDIGDPDLDPETSWNFDIGVKTRGDRLQTSASLFYNRISDYIVKENQGTGDYIYKNYSDVALYGAETSLDYDLGGGFITFASLSYVHGENEDTGEALPGIPPLKARYGLRYDTFVGDNWLWAELSGTTASSQHRTGVNERSTENYTRGDLRVGLDLGETWSLVGAVENFADTKYQDHLSTVWQEYGVTDQPGRNIKLMLKARF